MLKIIKSLIIFLTLQQIHTFWTMVMSHHETCLSQRVRFSMTNERVVLQDAGTSQGPYGHVADFSAIKELDMIQKEIDDIKK